MPHNLVAVHRHRFKTATKEQPNSRGIAPTAFRGDRSFGLLRAKQLTNKTGSNVQTAKLRVDEDSDVHGTFALNMIEQTDDALPRRCNNRTSLLIVAQLGKSTTLGR